MRSRDNEAPRMAELDRQTGEVMSPWFASRTENPPPPSVLIGVQERIPVTRRRAAWRIPDWWLWRRGAEQRAGFLLATATSVVLLAVVGLASAGVFMVAVVDAPESGPLAAGAAAEASPAEASTQGAVAASPAGEASIETPAVTTTAEPIAFDVVPLAMADVSGSVLQAPAVVREGTSSSPREGWTDVTGIETEAIVEFDDERLSGTEHVVRNERHFGADGEGSVAAGSIRIENDGGFWTGTFESISPPGREGSLRTVELTGGSGYDGLSALLNYDLGKGWGDPEMITGIIDGERPPYPDREFFDYYAVFADDIPKPKLRDPEARDAEGLPAFVQGSLDQTIFWISDDTSFSEIGPETQTAPQWMAGDLSLGDPRLELEGYELMLNAHFGGFFENGSIGYGRSRGTSDDGGAWRGAVRSFSSPDEPALLGGLHQATRLTGTGAYEGLSAVLFSSPLPVDPLDELDSWSVEGMLFAGGLPDYPEVP